MKHAIIENDLVVNVVICELEHAEEILGGQGWQYVQSDEANIGDSYIDGEFIKPVIDSSEEI